MAEIIKVYREHLPPVRFIGKRYTNADRLNGNFGHKWREWYQNDWFSPLEKLGKVEHIENGCLGFMRCHPNVEYWIGMFLPCDTPVPDGYDFIDLEGGNIGVCWIKGNDTDGSIYAMHEKCIERLKENGMSLYKEGADDRAYFFERYNCPRFSKKDEQGNVILDYGVYLAE